MDESKIAAYILGAAKFGGVGSLCYSISLLENWERYEECAIILEAVRRIMGKDWTLEGGIRWGYPLELWLKDTMGWQTAPHRSSLLFRYSEYAGMLNKFICESIFPI